MTLDYTYRGIYLLNESDLDDLIDRYLVAEAALRDAQAQQAAAWHPIETAPKDGTVVLLYQPAGRWKSSARSRQQVVSTGYWHQPGNPASPGFWCAAVMVAYRPTHWMPLPLPPAPDEAPGSTETP